MADRTPTNSSNKVIDLVDSSPASSAKSPTSPLRITRARTTNMLEQGEKSPIKVTRSKQAHAKRKFVDDSDSTDPEDDNLLVTPNVPPPAQRIVHPKTGAVYKNVTREVYERSKEEELDWFGWTVPPAQHNKFMAPNETFVVFSRREGEMDRYSFATNEEEFARVGFFKKIVDSEGKNSK